MQIENKFCKDIGSVFSYAITIFATTQNIIDEHAWQYTETYNMSYRTEKCILRTHFHFPTLYGHRGEGQNGLSYLIAIFTTAKSYH